LEKEKCLVSMNEKGFKLLNENDKENDDDEDSYFELLGTLLMEKSPLYKQAFHNSLFKKLENLVPEEDEDEDLEDFR
jgi:hypothetical protein